MFDLEYNRRSLKKAGKFIAKNKNLAKELDSTLVTISQSPFDSSLKTHKVNSKK